MKKMTIVFLAMIVSVFTTYGQDKGNSLLWKISGKNLEQPSYLYGTFHLLCPDDLQIQDKVTDAMEACDQLVLELDFDDPSVMPTIQKNMAYSDGTTAKDYLNEQEYNMLSDFFRDSLNLPFERLESIKPFFLSSMTLMHFLSCQPASFEQRLTSMAGDLEMEIKGLESVEEQIQFIDNLSMDYQKKMLMENLKNYDSSKMMFDRMIGYYLNDNLKGLHSISESYMSEDYAEFKEQLLTRRNQRWVPVIEELIGDNASFIAVGAAHLPGKEGVIQLLRQAGYKVEPVYQPFR